MKRHTKLALRASLVGFLITFIGFIASTLYHIYDSTDGERGKEEFQIILSSLQGPTMKYVFAAGLLFGFVYFYFGIKSHQKMNRNT